MDIGVPGQLDPLRYQPGIAYRHFPDQSNLERLAVGITVDADGTGTPKILWGEFDMNVNGTLTPVGESGMLTFPQTPSTDPYWAPGFAYLPTGELVMGYNWADVADEPGTVVKGWSYRTPGYGEGVWTERSQVRSFSPSSKFVSVGNVRPVAGMVRGFSMGGTFDQFVPTQTRFRLLAYNLTAHTAVEKVFATDECNVTLTCTRVVTLATPSGFSLPMFKK